VRDRFDLALPVIRATSSSEPGAFSAITRSSSRFPAERTLANDSVEVNQTLPNSCWAWLLGSCGQLLPLACYAAARAFIRQ
jgi:hypothetical protein